MCTGGHHHTGWLPDNAILPEDAPIVERTLEVEIQDDAFGFLLIWRDAKNDSFVCDTWHESFEKAKQAANEYFGIDEDDWQVPDATGAQAELV